MLFKFASYLLGTNNEEESKPDQQQQLNIESNEIQDTQPETQVNSSTDLTNEEKEILTDEVNSDKQEDLVEDEYMYDEQLINCSKLKNSNSNLQSDFNKEDQLCDQLEDDDYEDEQWIYITPIKRKNEEKEINEEISEFRNEVENSALIDEKNASKENVPKTEESQNANKEEFNFFDYFNNKSHLTTLNEEQCCSPVKSSKLDSSSTATKKPSANKKLSNHKLQQVNRMEQSWNFLPPACFQFENTFTIEEHPLENLLLENPALSVISSTEKESNGSASLTNSSLNCTTKSRILVDRNLNNQTKKEAFPASRKQMRRIAKSSRKSNKKQNDKKNRTQTKKADVSTSENVSPASSPRKSLPVEKVEKEVGKLEEKQVLCDEKQLLAHYLTSDAIASSSSNGSTHQSQTTTHHPHLHFIASNNCVATSTNSSVENKKGSKSLRRETKRNNKVALKRENLSNKPFTLHRKLC